MEFVRRSFTFCIPETGESRAPHPTLIAATARVDIKRESSTRSFTIFTCFYGGLLPDHFTGARVAKTRARIIESLLNVEHFETGPIGIEIGDVQCIAVAQSRRVQSATVIVDRRRTINDLVAPVAVNIRNAQVVIALSSERRPRSAKMCMARLLRK